jgi:hypothetical protein
MGFESEAPGPTCQPKEHCVDFAVEVIFPDNPPLHGNSNAPSLKVLRRTISPGFGAFPEMQPQDIVNPRSISAPQQSVACVYVIDAEPGRERPRAVFKIARPDRK